MPTAGKAKIIRDIDPTTFSVVWNKFDYIVEDRSKDPLSTQSFVTALVDLGQSLPDSKGRIVRYVFYTSSYHGR
jgi:hypothetical protein